MQFYGSFSLGLARTCSFTDIEAYFRDECRPQVGVFEGQYPEHPETAPRDSGTTGGAAGVEKFKSDLLSISLNVDVDQLVLSKWICS